MTPKKQKADTTSVMALTAVYCDDVKFAMNNMGLRLTFGEKSIIQGEPTTYRMAVHLPASAVDPFIDTLVKARADRVALIQTQAKGQPAQGGQPTHAVQN